MIVENTFLTQKTARYYTLGEPSQKIKDVWFILHGYGQLAKDFLREFELISKKNNLIVAPEALNKFYFRGLSGNIGASWMTKEDRENEKSDYVNFLNTVYQKIIQDPKAVNFNILGFSQGCHTVIRWLNKEKIKVSKLILWSGSFPEDVNYAGENEYWSSLDIKLVLGSKDRLVEKKFILNQINNLKELGIKIDFKSFEGGHKIDNNLLMMLMNS